MPEKMIDLELNLRTVADVLNQVIQSVKTAHDDLPDGIQQIFEWGKEVERLKEENATLEADKARLTRSAKGMGKKLYYAKKMRQRHEKLLKEQSEKRKEQELKQKQYYEEKLARVKQENAKLLAKAYSLEEWRNDLERDLGLYGTPITIEMYVGMLENRVAELEDD